MCLAHQHTCLSACTGSRVDSAQLNTTPSAQQAVALLDSGFTPVTQSQENRATNDIAEALLADGGAADCESGA